MDPFDSLNKIASRHSTGATQSTDPMEGIRSFISSDHSAPQKEATPSYVKTAAGDVGDQSYNGYCQQFVEQVALGRTGVYPSAVEAWNGYTQSGKAKSGIAGAKPGDLVYFAPDPSNGNYGHTGIVTGNNKFISATYSGVKEADLSDWQKQTGQQILGHVTLH